MTDQRYGRGAGGFDGEAHLEDLRAEIDQVERRANRTLEFGRRGFGIAVLVFVLVVAVLLPWTSEQVGGEVTRLAGWQALLGQAGFVPQLFALTVVAIGIVGAAAALIIRRWWLTWICAVGGWLTFVTGLLAVWSQQSTAEPGASGEGPGVGMVLALVTAIVLAINWMRVTGSRTSGTGNG